MKHLLISFCFTILFLHAASCQSTYIGCYDENYVEITVKQQGGEAFGIVGMKRSNNRVKAKYFAGPDEFGKNAYERYLNWSMDKHIVLVSAGTYVDNWNTPVGLNIDNGRIVNNSLSDKFDGLVIVYPTGGIAVSDLKEGNLSLAGSNVDPTKKYDIKNSAYDFSVFINWARSEKATVFQTHLLAYRNINKVSYFNSSPNKANRRFLAVGKDANGTIIHYIINYPYDYTLFQGVNNVLRFLKEVLHFDLTFMLNLDTGQQNVFYLYNKDCTINKTIEGRLDMSIAQNILVYYFE